MEIREKPQKSKKFVVSVMVFVIGLAALIAGVVFLVVNLGRGATLQDGEYLVSADEWILDDEVNCAPSAGEDADEMNCVPSVIWQFTEIGKGTLTTNGHLNDYDFIWALEGDRLLIETDWLYDLENEYTYELNQSEGTLVLTDGETEYRFTAYFENEE